MKMLMARLMPNRKLLDNRLPQEMFEKGELFIFCRCLILVMPVILCSFVIIEKLF